MLSQILSVLIQIQLKKYGSRKIKRKFDITFDKITNL